MAVVKRGPSTPQNPLAGSPVQEDAQLAACPQEHAQLVARLQEHARLAARLQEHARLAARRSLRDQIARLEGDLADAFVTAYRMGGIEPPVAARGQPRLLGLGELERVRDELVQRLLAARVTIADRAEVQAAKRVQLERMLLEPRKHKFARVAARELGEPGCGVWQVKPRLGLLGMLMGWWEVKLSSGCPLAQGRGPNAGGPRKQH